MRLAPTIALMLLGLIGGMPSLGICQQDASEDAQVIAAAISILRESFVRPLDEATIASNSVADLLRKIDPDHGQYLTKEEIGLLRSSQTVDLGLSFRRRDREIQVVPRAQWPAALAGLKLGDRLEQIDGQDTQGMGLWELHKLLSSPRQRVTLTVRRGDSALSFVINVPKASDLPRRVQVHWPAPDILVLGVQALSNAVLKESVEVLSRHWRRDIRGIIVDLRGNFGGELSSAVGFASMFLPDNSIVATFRSNSSFVNNHQLRATPNDYSRRGTPDPLRNLPAATRTIPLAVVIDESTSAGAEIIASAVQHHQRGIIVGKQSAGATSIRTLSALPNGAVMMYTSAFGQSPSGKQINDVGLVPDVPVSSSEPEAAIAAAVLALSASRRGAIKE